MKQPYKQILIIVHFAITITFFIMYSQQTENLAVAEKIFETDLEIYTYNNIYYVKGNIVTNESNSTVMVFEDKTSLKNYISDITAEDVNSITSHTNILDIEILNNIVPGEPLYGYYITLQEGRLIKEFKWDAVNNTSKLIVKYNK